MTNEEPPQLQPPQSAGQLRQRRASTPEEVREMQRDFQHRKRRYERTIRQILLAISAALAMFFNTIGVLPAQTTLTVLLVILFASLVNGTGA